MKRQLLTLAGATLSMLGYAQCPVNAISGDLIISTDIIMSGTYNVSGTFRIEPGINVLVESFANDSCGKLTVNAPKIEILGSINGDASGYTGGAGGLGALAVNSVTGDQNALTACSNKDNAGQVTLGGGQAGTPGNGPGAGAAGNNGSVGSGPKQQCQNNGDEYGLIGGSAGAGGGGGASYGGDGTLAGNGGNGSAQHTASNVSVSPAYAVLGGTGGMGGNAGLTYGTVSGNDIEPGSGGAGAGGGGRSFYQGSNGNRGGNGGGAVELNAQDSLVITGTISVNGENGLAGGTGGNGDQTTDCCSDACNDAGERTLSAGAGGGAGSGAGSGGGILLSSPRYSAITGILSANGGNGGAAGTKGNGTTSNYNGGVFCGTQSITSGNGNDGSNGGNGGGGRIKIFISDCADNIFTGSYTVNGGFSPADSAASGTYHLGQSVCPPAPGTGIETMPELISGIFPNPAADFVYIKLGNEVLLNGATLSLSDKTGRIVKESYISNLSGNTIQYNVSDLSPGVYFIRISNQKGSSVKKLIKY